MRLLYCMVWWSRHRFAFCRYVFVDTPGQIEVFNWSSSGSIITQLLSSTFPTCVVFVLDTPRCVLFQGNLLAADIAPRWLHSSSVGVFGVSHGEASLFNNYSCQIFRVSTVPLLLHAFFSDLFHQHPNRHACVSISLVWCQEVIKTSASLKLYSSVMSSQKSSPRRFGVFRLLLCIRIHFLWFLSTHLLHVFTCLCSVLIETQIQLPSCRTWCTPSVSCTKRGCRSCTFVSFKDRTLAFGYVSPAK